MARWAKSWQTPWRWASTSATGVTTVVLSGSKRKSRWMRRLRSCTASRIGRPRGKRRRGIGGRGGRGGGAGRIEDELAREPRSPLGVRSRAWPSRGAIPRRGDRPKPASRRRRAGRRDDLDLADGGDGEAVVRLLHGEVEHAVAEEVVALGALGRRRVDGRPRSAGRSGAAVGRGCRRASLWQQHDRLAVVVARDVGDPILHATRTSCCGLRAAAEVAARRVARRARRAAACTCASELVEVAVDAARQRRVGRGAAAQRGERVVDQQRLGRALGARRPRRGRRAARRAAAVGRATERGLVSSSIRRSSTAPGSAVER